MGTRKTLIFADYLPMKACLIGVVCVPLLSIMRKKTFFLSFLLLIGVLSFAAEPVPHPAPDRRVPYEYINFLFTQKQNYDDFLIIVEKKYQQATLYKFINRFQEIEPVNTYSVSTGRAHGNKLLRGDLKTPEGLYVAVDFVPELVLRNRYGSLASQYGAGAWELGFPNELDRLRQKTGSGIWIHGTDVDMTPFDTEGCVRFENEVIIYFHKVLKITKTPVIIADVIQWVDIEFLEKEIENIQHFLMTWLDSWKRQDIDEYLAFYCSEKFVSRKQNMNYSTWERHKRNLFTLSRNGDVQINISNLDFYYADQLLLITFYQDYSAESLDDFGRKQLVLRRNTTHEDEISSWSIIQEEWTQTNSKSVFDTIDN